MIGAVFKPLFVAPILVAMLAAFVAADIWLFFGHGVAQALRQSIAHPGLFLPLFAAIVLSAAFHEIGHAAACRYGGGHPGKMGCGLYLAFPAFYTDVTDAYRLGKRARLRTDLGGLYFNVLVVLATTGAYFATHFEPLLLLVIIEHFEIAHQLLPVVRLDGYYIVADLTGVPDLFARIGPILRSLAPWNKADDRVTLLKRWVRVAVTAWVLIVIPLLLFEMLIVLIHLPRILGSAWTSGSTLWHAAGHAFARGNMIGGVSDAVQIVVLAIPIAGILLMLVSAAKRVGMWLWRHTVGRPAARTLAVVGAVVFAVLLAFAWIPRHNYAPIHPGERGTEQEGVAAVLHLLTGSGPLYSTQMAEIRAARSASGRSGSPSSGAGGPAPAGGGAAPGLVGPTGAATVPGQVLNGVRGVVTVPPVTVKVPPAPLPKVSAPSSLPPVPTSVSGVPTSVSGVPTSAPTPSSTPPSTAPVPTTTPTPSTT